MKFKPREENQGSKEGSLFVRPDGEKPLVGVLRGDLYDFFAHGFGKQTLVCTGKSQCEACRAGDKGKFKFRVNFLVEHNGELSPRILELGRTVYDALRDLQDSGYDLESHLVSISKKGSGMNTEYTVVPVPRGELKAAELKKLESVKLLDLSHPKPKATGAA